MGLLETLLLTVGVSATTAGILIGILRLGGPLLAKIFGAAFKTRAQLDGDRDRIIVQLRAWNSDLEERLDKTEVDLKEARDEVERLNAFIDMLLSRLGTTRQAVEQGVSLPVPRHRRS